MSFRDIRVVAPGVPGFPPPGLSVMPTAVPPQLMGVPTNALLPGVQANSLAAVGADQAALMVGPILPFDAMPHMPHMFMQPQQMQQAAQPQGQQNQQESQQGSGKHCQRQPRRNTDQQQGPQKLQFLAKQESSFERPSEKPAPLPSSVLVPAVDLVHAMWALVECLPYEGMGA